MKTNYAELWRHVSAQFACGPDSIHGPTHWEQVERNGLKIAAHNGANQDVVRLFAVLHDSQRVNDGWDPDHGPRAAGYAATLRGTWFDLADAAFEQLRHACLRHTNGDLSEDPTIGACWDGDRLDLVRVRTQPAVRLMSTELGRRLALQIPPVGPRPPHR
ncbi:MAG TPA: hypothetical protein VGD78_04300 [Chthoniobacterales bacterium]